MKSKKRIVIAGMLCAVLAFSVWYVQRPVVLKLGIFTGGSWNVPSTSTYEYIDSIIRRFEKDHPGVYVQYESGIRHADYPEWMADHIISGQCPDVFLVLDTDFYEYVQLGVLKNLNSFLSSDKEFNESSYYPGILEQARYHFEQFALPFEYNPVMMFINESLLEQEGIPLPDKNWNMDDFCSICRQITKDRDRNDTIDQFGVIGFDWEDALNAYGVQLIDPDGSVNLNQPDVRKAIQTLIDLNALYEKSVPSQADLDEGKVAFAPMSYAEFITYNPYPWRIKRYSDFDWLCVPMPSKTGYAYHYDGSALYMGMSNHTRYAHLSWDLLKAFCYEEESQKDVVLYGLGISPVRTVASDPEIIQYYDSLGISVSLINAIMDYSAQNETYLDESVKNKLDAGIRAMIDGDEDLDIALMELEQKINEKNP